MPAGAVPTEIDHLPLLELLVDPVAGPFSVILRPFLHPFLALMPPEKTSSVYGVYGSVLLPAAKSIDTFVLTFLMFAVANAAQKATHTASARCDYEKLLHWLRVPLVDGGHFSATTYARAARQTDTRMTSGTPPLVPYESPFPSDCCAEPLSAAQGVPVVNIRRPELQGHRRGAIPCRTSAVP